MLPGITPALFGSSAGIDSFVVLLLHLDGPGATFVDSSLKNKTIANLNSYTTTVGMPHFGAAVGVWSGNAADGLYMAAGINDPDFAFGTGDFTIDFWFRIAAGATAVLYDQRPLGGEGAYPTIYYGANLIYYANGANMITGTTTLVINTWYHVAIARASGVTKMFLNGTLEGSVADATNYLNDVNRPVFANASKAHLNALNGWTDELRVSKGVARWTSAFSPPTAPYSR